MVVYRETKNKKGTGRGSGKEVVMTDWNIFDEMEKLRADVNRMFGEVPGSRPWRLAFLPGLAARRYPLVNVSETDGGYKVVALAPGVHPGSFEVTVKDNVLTLSGEKRPPEDVSPDEYHRSERSEGRFVRSLELPGGIDPDRVKASYTNGLLTVMLEKNEAAKPRLIPVDND
jgi:HSP20 family protein